MRKLKNLYIMKRGGADGIVRVASCIYFDGES